MVNAKPNLVVPLRVTSKCPSHARSDISVRDLSFSIDEPEQRGGTNSGPSPTETALAALIGCTNVIGHKCAKKLNHDIGHLSFKLRCEFDRRGVTLEEEIDLPFRKIDMTIESDGTASQAQLDEVAKEVAMYCPLSKLFRQSGTVINENWCRKSQAE